jgi:hypothetical protein
MADILTTTRATKAGVYIGRVFRPTPAGLAAFSRVPCLVGKGNRLQTVFNQPIRRSFRNNVAIDFSPTSPHIATLSYAARNDQTVAKLYKSTGQPVPQNQWSFTESTPNAGYNQVLIVPEVFDANADYFIDYQSTSATIRDELPFNELREIRFIGDTESQDRYVENRNYYIPITLSTTVAGVLNADTGNNHYNDRDFTTPAIASGTNNGSAVLTVLAGTFTGDYSRLYTVTVTGVNTTVDASVKITLLSGGNSVEAPSPVHTSLAVPVGQVVNFPTPGGTSTDTFTDPATGDVVTLQLADTSTTGTGDTISGTAPTMTLTDAGGTFTATDVGRYITISGATTPANNGSFLIAGYTSGTVITYTNASGVAEAFTGTYSIPNVSTGDVFTFAGLGPSLIEVAGEVLNTNQFSTIGAVTETVTNASVALTIRNDASYTGTNNRNYHVQCTAAAGVSPSRTATFVWTGYGENPVTEGTFSISEAAETNLERTLENGIKVDLDFGSVNFVVGDKFTFTATAARSLITAKDSRNYTLTVQSAAAGTVSLQYVTTTPEGSFAIVPVTTNGSLRLPGGVDLRVRNIGTLTGQNRYVAADEWTFSTVDEEVIDWTLKTRVEETISSTEFFTDMLGTVTEVVGATYIIIQNIPSNILYVKDAVTGDMLTATALTDQPIIWFINRPDNNVKVSYEYSGIEPSPGQLYYITANILRPDELYNVPVLSLTYDDASRLLGPSATNNDLLIAAEIALNDNGAPGIYTCQAKDSDSDGVISSVDINNAVLATENNNKLTDVIVLNGNTSLSTALTSNEKMNDPFERKERALWVGLPVGSTIGNTDSAGTVAFTAKRTLQVYGDNHAHGTRVLLANSRAVKTITLTDGTQTDVTLDGSFIQTAIAAKNASFTDPGSTILRQFISGFKSINVFTEPEEYQLQELSVLYVSNQGSSDAPVFRIEESVTVDTSAPDNNEISVAINQKQFVTKQVRETMENALIAVVPPSEAAGVAIVRSFLVGKLVDMIGKGLIGPYTDDSGNSRTIDPSVDVEVFRDRTDKTLYHFKYYWMGRYPIKRLFGMYSVDKRFFSQQ